MARHFCTALGVGRQRSAAEWVVLRRRGVTRVPRKGSCRPEALRVTGDLTIRGVTCEVVLDVEYAGRTKDPWGNERAGFSATTAIDRKDFGLTWNQALEAGGVVVGDRVTIEIEVEAVKQTAVKVA